MLITIYPYQSHHDLAAFDRAGAIVNYDIEDDDAKHLTNSALQLKETH